MINMNTNNEISDLVVKAYKHQKNGDLSLAIQGWNALINHSSTDKELISNAFLNLGNLHLQQGNGDLAYECMAKAISANPNSSEAFFCMAYMEQEKENFNEAINFFEAALKLKPKDVGAINNLGNCYDRLNAADKAKIKMVFNIPRNTGESKSDGEYIRNTAIQSRVTVNGI